MAWFDCQYCNILEKTHFKLTGNVGTFAPFPGVAPIETHGGISTQMQHYKKQKDRELEQKGREMVKSIKVSEDTRGKLACK